MLCLPVIAQAQELRIISGVSFQGHPLGGLNMEQTEVLFCYEERKLNKQKIILIHSGQEIESSYREWGVGLDRERIWREAVALGRAGPWWRRFWLRWEIRKNGCSIPLYLKVDKSSPPASVLEYARSLQSDARNAGIRITAGNKVVIEPEVYGQEVDWEALHGVLTQELAVHPGEVLRLPVTLKKVRPEKTKKDYEDYKITGLLSEFTTQFSLEKTKRVKNMKIAARSLDQVLIAPGEIFSFNRSVGPRTKEAGYDEADIILNNEMVPGIGGGVCQVSSTLYNAVLEAGLPVIERYHHSLLISYVKPGLDATVAYDSKDLKFLNNTSSYLLVSAGIDQNRLICKIFGHPVSGRKVVIKDIKECEIPPKTVYRKDPGLPDGEYFLEREGLAGCVIRVVRETYEGDRKASSEVISRDTYQPVDRILKVSQGSLLLSN